MVKRLRCIFFQVEYLKLEIFLNILKCIINNVLMNSIKINMYIANKYLYVFLH